MEAFPVASLQPGVEGEKIVVRVCRTWRPRVFKSEHQYNGLRYILVDCLGAGIEAKIDEIDYDLLSDCVKVGKVYTIDNYHVNESSPTFKVVPHAAMLEFIGKTIFKEVTDVSVTFPSHAFSLVDFGELRSRMGTNLLSDIIGHVTMVKPLETKKVARGSVITCEIYVQNLRNEEIRVTLWSDAAEAFDMNTLLELSPPTFIVFTSLRVKEFQGKLSLNSTPATVAFLHPYVPDLSLYEVAFLNWKKAITVLAGGPIPRLTSEQLQEGQLKSLREIRRLSSEEWKAGAIICKAKIQRYNVRGDWYYYACPHCSKKMQQIEHDSRWHCDNHPAVNILPIPYYKIGMVLDDGNDELKATIIGPTAEDLYKISCSTLYKQMKGEQEFPPQILDTLHQERVFQIRSGTQKYDSTQKDFLIHAVLHQESHLLNHDITSVPRSSEISLHTPPAQLRPRPPVRISSSTETRLASSTKFISNTKRALFLGTEPQAKKMKGHAGTKSSATSASSQNPPLQTNQEDDDVVLSSFIQKTTSINVKRTPDKNVPS